MLLDTLPGCQALPGILQGSQTLVWRPAKTDIARIFCLQSRHFVNPCQDAANYKTCLAVN
ncbi:hypothetical protein E2C01_046408 [Portunus trituberculatus]|uniref:Uncharacterized protein n=1 Tax=Portunus trituberculatus TaxID=210409 RepID=A0A5B7G4T7_PORTR|nr:hypothetical protein [Portunus trituberculatus]